MTQNLIAVFLGIVVLCGVARWAQAQPSPNEYFEEGRRLVEANCSDCRSATKANLEKGLANVRSAIAAGYPDKVEAYKVLAEGLRTFQFVFSAPDSAAQADAERERRRLCEQLVELRPKDAQIAFMYAEVLRDQDAQLEACRRVIWLDPRHAGAHFSIGMILHRKGQHDDAVSALRLALEFGNAGQTEAYGRDLINVLTELGRTGDIEDVRAIIASRTAK